MKTAPIFRGKRLDNGEMVEGNLFVEHDGLCSISYNRLNFKHTWKHVPVNPSTVEQIGGDVVDENKRLRAALKGAKAALQSCDRLFDYMQSMTWGGSDFGASSFEPPWDDAIESLKEIEEALKGEMK